MGVGHRIGGHRGMPHTADLGIEAWAPTREECLAEAVRGLVASRHVTARPDADLLVAVIDEVIYRLDANGEIPGLGAGPACGRRRNHRLLRAGARRRGGDYRRGAEGGVAARAALRA